MGLQKDRRGGKSDYTGECPAREGYDPLMGSRSCDQPWRSEGRVAVRSNGVYAEPGRD